MTYKEANYVIDDISWVYNGKAVTAEMRDDCRKLCHEALERQIPKVPAIWGDGYSDGELVMESYECPHCGCLYDFDIDGKIKFCKECGQSLDWNIY